MTVDEYNERLKELLKIQTDAREKFGKAKRTVINFCMLFNHQQRKQLFTKTHLVIICINF